MPKIVGARERRHQPFWDTVIRGTVGNFTIAGNAATLQNTNRLFQTAGQGNIAISNMEAGGMLPSDQTYRILALRCGLYFRGCAGTVGAVALNDHIMYHRALSQNFWELRVSEKTAFSATTPYLPLGGGLFGDIGGDTTLVYFNNGVPSHEAICKLARSVALPARQGFSVINTIVALGAANYVNDVNGITAGEVDVKFYLDGLHVRDIL